MKQVFQNLSSGKLLYLNSCTEPSSGCLLIRSTCSLLSSGTERTLVEFSKADLLHKARLQPAKVQEALYKAKTDGILSTYDAIQSKLNQPLPLGYSNGCCRKGGGCNRFQCRRPSSAGMLNLLLYHRIYVLVFQITYTDEEASFTVLAPSVCRVFALLNLSL